MYDHVGGDGVEIGGVCVVPNTAAAYSSRLAQESHPELFVNVHADKLFHDDVDDDDGSGSDCGGDGDRDDDDDE